MRLSRWFLTVLCAFCLMGCVQHLNPRPHAARNFVPWTDDPVPYRLSPGDSIGLRFVLNPELNEESLPVATDGTLAAPLVGAVPAAGNTVDALHSLLQVRYAKYLRNPALDVMIHSYTAAQAYVGGEVKKQGIYPMQGPLSVMQAVVMAGGASDTAAMSETILIRRRADGRPMMRTIDLRRYLNTADSRDNVGLQPGDVVYVPKTEIGSFDLFIDQYLDKSIPFNRTLNYNAGSAMFF